MSSGTKDQVKGTLQKAKGSVKVVLGKVTDNPKLQAKGVAEKAQGAAKAKVGQVKKVIGK